MAGDRLNWVDVGFLVLAGIVVAFAVFFAGLGLGAWMGGPL